ncbi:glycosyltransferase family 2 protein [Kitasatospora purpeofusca]|uniref:glycosyltransferase family 2 protein n=1 Tax=Kitasatospora purpeofusca TaxID=67352 RepID=UPI002256DAF8|nr:glycosyltransferase family 2 protein [Kitasatospora purpeofusca]MCX4758662.1 glycosyltransferase [Kitasatospora purpeofusca]WSR30903.1 glycosyltransferase [Kitasatospora purpeofusca]
MTGPTLADVLKTRPNIHRHLTEAFTERTSIGWHQPTRAHAATGRPLSVVLPARNTAYALPVVLDALAAQQTAGPVEVIVVDDASTDATFEIARRHPAVTTAVRLPTRRGSATARNIGARLAQAPTLLFVDADMVLPPHVLADVAARASTKTVLTGFRHNTVLRSSPCGWVLPDGPPSLAADHRVTWTPPANTVLPYSGITLSERLDGRPLDATDDFQTLGCGRFYHDWNLPRMVVTALLAVPREPLVDVGGFEEEFGRLGWGMEDTHLGAALIASGCLVVPLRQAVGYHLDPPDAAAQWQAKLATWPATLAHYRRLLDRPAPSGRGHEFATATDKHLTEAEVVTP